MTPIVGVRTVKIVPNKIILSIVVQLTEGNAQLSVDEWDGEVERISKWLSFSAANALENEQD